MPPNIAVSTQRGLQSMDTAVASSTTPAAVTARPQKSGSASTRSSTDHENNPVISTTTKPTHQSDLAYTNNGIASALDPQYQQQQQQQNVFSSQLGNYGFGGGMHSDHGGMGSLYGGVGALGSIYGSPYGYGGAAMMPPMATAGGFLGGSLSNLNQFLFSVQSVIFSLGQAVQIIGMNTQALKQLLESISSMIDHAVASWNEMQKIEAASREQETEEMKKKRRRLRAFRMALLAAVSYLGYRIVKWMFSPRRAVPSITSYPHQYPYQQQQQPQYQSGQVPHNYNVPHNTG